MKRQLKTGKIFVSIALCIITLLSTAGSVLAKSRSYVYDGKDKMPIPEAYLIKQILFYNGELNAPEDIFINDEGYIFVADTNNNRIVKMTKEGDPIDVFLGPEEKPLKAPKGVYADQYGNMYIADTGNRRIVHLSRSGTFIEEFTKPESNLLGADFVFEPTKVSLSPNGFLYVLNGQSIMMIDAYNGFRGFIGQANVGFYLIDVILRKFASDEQKMFIRKRVPVYYTNFTMSESGMIYATSLDTVEGEIKKLNSIGKNIYKNSTKNYQLYLRDITVDKNGIITVLDNKSCKIYQYDGEGNLLAVFGGEGLDRTGMFKTPSSIEVDNDGYLYVLDSYKNNIQVFQPTHFINQVHKAVKLYSNGEYDGANGVWNEVLKIDEGYHIANTGKAKTLYKQGQWNMAMDEYLKADDKEGYSQAFSKYRHEIFRKYFILVVLGLTILTFALYYMISGIRKIARKTLDEFEKNGVKSPGIGSILKLAFATLTNPIETFELIKRNRDNFNYLPSIIILVSVVAARVFYIFTIHYPLSNIRPRDANLFLEVVKFIVPVLTWVIANFAITSISGGESKMGEIFVASSFSMVPYIVINIPVALLTNLLSIDESLLFKVIVGISWVWVFLLFFISLRTLNDYTVKKAIGTCIINIAMMALIWAVLILIYVLSTQLYEFVIGIIREAQMQLL